MKKRQWVVIGATAFLLTVFGPPGKAPAATPQLSGRTSTVVEWYGTANDETATPVYQYLLLNARDLDGDGLNFRGYGRLAKDFSNEVDVDSRLYYGYLDKNNLSKNLDLRLGRQFLATTAGAAMMDGLLVRLRDLGGYKVSLFGGGDVAYYRGYNEKDLLAGGEVRTTLKEFKLGASYVQKWQSSNTTFQLFGVDAEYEYRNRLNLYSELQYNYMAESVSYFLAGAKYHESSNWSVRGEYLYSLPVFSATSIYSVFAVDEYEEVTGELRYRIDTGLYSFARLQHEIYREVADADVFEAGIEKIRTDRFSGYLSGVYRIDDDGQDLRGLKVHGSYLVFKALQCGAGANVDVFERRLDEEEDETTSTRYWLDVAYAFTKRISLLAKAEMVSSDIWDNYYRGRIRLNTSF